MEKLQMGMTYWIHTLNDRVMTKDSNDNTMIYRLSDELDIACDELGIAKISSFADYTDLEFNMSDEDEDEDEDEDLELELDAETGYAYGIDDMLWFNVADGIEILEKLCRYVTDGWKYELHEETKKELIEELDYCIEKLKSIPHETGKFHLAVIM
jgi:hypothetical protein